MAFEKTIKFNGKEFTVHDFTFGFVVSPDLLQEIIEIEDLNWDKDEVQIWDTELAEELLENVKDGDNVDELDIEEFVEKIELLKVKLVDCIVVSKW